MIVYRKIIVRGNIMGSNYIMVCIVQKTTICLLAFLLLYISLPLTIVTFSLNKQGWLKIVTHLSVYETENRKRFFKSLLSSSHLHQEFIFSIKVFYQIMTKILYHIFTYLLFKYSPSTPFRLLDDVTNYSHLASKHV